MTEKKNDTNPLQPPERDSKTKRKRVALNAAIQAIPYAGGPLSTIFDAATPPKSTLEREAWEDRATNQINENTDRIEEAFSGKRTSMEGFPAELLVALLKDCPDGLCSKRYELSKLLDMFPDHSKEDIQDASYDLEQHGLLEVQPGINGCMVRLEAEAYEQVDHQIMGWNPLEDAVELAKLMIETNEGTASTLQNQLGWPKRRFNPAQRIIIDNVPEGCVRNVIQPDFVSIGVLFTPECRANLRRFISRYLIM